MKRTIVLAVAAVALTTACASGQARSAPTNSARSAPQAVQDGIVALHQRWSGTAADLQAGQVVRAHALNEEYSACMQSKGYDEFDWRKGIQIAPLPDSGLSGLLEPFGRTQVQTEALATARSAAYEYVANHPETSYAVWNDQVVAATDECLATSTAADDEELSALVTPDGYEDLAQAWYGVERTQKVLLFDIGSAVATAYAACMGTRGYGDGKVRADDGYAPTMMGRLRREIKAPDRADWRVVNDPPKRQRSTEWKALTADEQQWLDADEACRADIVAEHIEDVAAYQAEFAQQHADEIRTVEQGWAEIRAEAAALGWAPDRPFAE